ncbi:transcription factor bHLH36-like [Gossypium arboreum]|uniref:BHLH domain-containing protein n=1 Tax=Gossypium arboreum TaxID=29729 RepID=A0ABR0MXQ6_GOSAR|nr:transcription factor bHLH36-like [Gossypium arboreum]KAK5778037.1 hypothetical protein PVK06_046004 [Gossypium arboreum]
MDELFLFQFPSIPNPQNETPQDKVLDYVVPMDGSGNTHLYSSMGSGAAGNDDDDDNGEKKKLMHRDVERQRRQEMATLYASLRNLLPLEYIKGKRAISDHMNGAVMYIKYLQKRVSELSYKRDELKKVLNSTGFDHGMSYDGAVLSTAVVHQSLDGGVELVISTGFGAGALTLSRVLELLVQEGLDVVSCVSTRINGGLVHTIQSEVIDLTLVDLPRLEQKLSEEISSLNRIS